MTPVLVDRDGPVAIVTLNRPDRMNAINTPLREAFIDALTSANSDPEIKAIIITGAGERAFSAGIDLDESSRTPPDKIGDLLAHQQAAYQAVRDLDKGCVAAYNGVAAGAGFQIGLCCDFQVAFPEVRIGQPEVKVGFASIVGSALMAPHCTIGVNKTLSLLGDLVDGRRAFEVGLVTHLVEKDAVRTTALDLAHQLAETAPTAMRLTKQRFREVTQAAFEEACIEGQRAQVACFESGEPQALQAAFLAKREAAKSEN